MRHVLTERMCFSVGFYNDHHFHYGYHIYAAAVVAHFDERWGQENYERVLLLIRDFANPSSTLDRAFPVFRNKDWYFGSSWASGITRPIFPNGMNQESSSEAIAAYEAVALFGSTMVRCTDLRLADPCALLNSL
jgi:endo-1,3(4)-beta-glucanase